jgi:hypothetical protein
VREHLEVTHTAYQHLRHYRLPQHRGGVREQGEGRRLQVLHRISVHRQFIKTHGGRSFLKSPLLGDNIDDYLAPCNYEGEGDMLGMAFFKSLVKDYWGKLIDL